MLPLSPERDFRFWPQSDVVRFRLGLMEDRVQVELEQLRTYARGVGQAVSQSPERTDIVDSGRGYLGGALTTLHHLELLDDDELAEWWQRLMDELPPTRWLSV